MLQGRICSVLLGHEAVAVRDGTLEAPTAIRSHEFGSGYRRLPVVIGHTPLNRVL